jgi:hypothetical protein
MTRNSSLAPISRYAVDMPKSQRQQLIKMQAARAAIRAALGNRCAKCGCTPEPIKVLRRTRKGHRSTRSHIEVSQLHGHHLAPGALGDRFDYVAHAKEIPSINAVSSSDGQHVMTTPSLVLLCVKCHKEIHKRGKRKFQVFILFCFQVPWMCTVLLLVEG